MSGTGDTVLGGVVIIAIVAAPCIWAYEKMATPLFWTMVIVGVGGLIVWHIRQEQQQEEEFQQNFQALVLRTLTEPAPMEQKSLLRTLMRTRPDHARALRAVQIIGESARIALNSKKRETAEARLALMNEQQRSLQCAFVLHPETQTAIQQFIEQTERQFHTAFWINLAKSHLEKAVTLKTEAARRRNQEAARAALAEGLRDPLSDKAMLAAVAESIPSP